MNPAAVGPREMGTQHYCGVAAGLIFSNRNAPCTARASGCEVPGGTNGRCGRERATVLVCHLAGNFRFETNSDLK